MLEFILIFLQQCLLKTAWKHFAMHSIISHYDQSSWPPSWAKGTHSLRSVYLCKNSFIWSHLKQLDMRQNSHHLYVCTRTDSSAEIKIFLQISNQATRDDSGDSLAEAETTQWDTILIFIMGLGSSFSLWGPELQRHDKKYWLLLDCQKSSRDNDRFLCGLPSLIFC